MVESSSGWQSIACVRSRDETRYRLIARVNGMPFTMDLMLPGHEGWWIDCRPGLDQEATTSLCVRVCSDPSLSCPKEGSPSMETLRDAIENDFLRLNNKPMDLSKESERLYENRRGWKCSKR